MNAQITVDEAMAARAALRGDAAKIADLIEACLNAEAAFSMLGFKPNRGRGFKPVGVLTVTQIGELLATMPAEVALVRAATAFACEFCGKPAETSGEDFWICEACLSASQEPARSIAGKTA